MNGMIWIARAGRLAGLNLNWIFDPVEAYRRGEPVFRSRQAHDIHGRTK